MVMLEGDLNPAELGVRNRDCGLENDVGDVGVTL